jgi:hypothetical protein
MKLWTATCSDHIICDSPDSEFANDATQYASTRSALYTLIARASRDALTEAAAFVAECQQLNPDYEPPPRESLTWAVTSYDLGPLTAALVLAAFKHTGYARGVLAKYRVRVEADLTAPGAPVHLFVMDDTGGTTRALTSYSQPD